MLYIFCLCGGGEVGGMSVGFRVFDGWVYIRFWGFGLFMLCWGSGCGCERIMWRVCFIY